MRPPRLEALTGLRFFAAMHVVLFHYAGFYLLTAPWWLRSSVGAGYVGVSFFFVLSGFVLTYTYLRPDAASSASWRAFWVARFARVYPVYLLSLLLALPVTAYYLAQGHTPAPALVDRLAGVGGQALLLLQAWDPWTVSDVNSPAWSLSDEAFFYALFPLAGPLVARWRGRRLWVAGAVLWLLSMVAPTLYVLASPGAGPTALPAHPNHLLKFVMYAPLFRLPEFLLGVVTATHLLTTPGRRSGGWIPAAGAIAAVLGALAIADRLSFPHLHDGLLGPLFALVILVVARGGGAVGGLLSHPVLVLLGEASYAIYILQEPLWSICILAAIRVTGSPAPHLRTPLYFVAFAAFLVLASVAAHLLVERPLRRRLRRALGPRSERRPAVPAPAADPL